MLDGIVAEVTAIDDSNWAEGFRERAVAMVHEMAAAHDQVCCNGIVPLAAEAVGHHNSWLVQDLANMEEGLAIVQRQTKRLEKTAVELDVRAALRSSLLCAC